MCYTVYMNELFRKFSNISANALGSHWAFIICLILTILWLISGPYFNFSTEWNFIANSSTTVLTFLAVFLIQNSQNRSDAATHAKLDEIIRSIEGARNNMIDLDNQSDKVIKEVREELKKVKDDINE